MILIVCVDDDMGMAFNRRRQSRDRVVTDRIVRLTADSELWVSGYTAQLFAGLEVPQLRTDDDFLRRAGPGAYCFAETADPSPCLDRAEGLVLYRWNRRYPSDVVLGLRPGEAPWIPAGVCDFPGYSHEKITEEIYTR